MKMKNPRDAKSFLKYFFCTYIPPYTYSIPAHEEIFKSIYLSAQDPWQAFYSELNRYPLSTQFKTKLIKLFELWDTLWEQYLYVTTDNLQMGDHSFRAWVSQPKIQNRWREIQNLAKEVDREAKPLYSA